MTTPLPDKKQEELDIATILETLGRETGEAWERYEGAEFDQDLDLYGEAYDKAFSKATKALTHYINKYYVPRDDVEKIIGEDEKIDGSSLANQIILSCNELRAEQREKLKSIRREKR